MLSLMSSVRFMSRTRATIKFGLGLVLRLVFIVRVRVQVRGFVGVIARPLA